MIVSAIQMGLDDIILNLLTPHGLTSTEISKSSGIPGLNDSTLHASLNRLCKHRFIRRTLYYTFSGRAKVYYVPFESEIFKVSTEKGKSPYVCAILRRDVILDDGTPCYYYVYLNCFGEELDHNLEPMTRKIERPK